MLHFKEMTSGRLMQKENTQVKHKAFDAKEISHGRQVNYEELYCCR